MKTVQQMLDLKPTTLCPALYKWSIKAAAMLRTQAAEIESLKVEYVKELDKVSERNYSLRKENEALKADAERLDLLESTFFAKRWNGVLDSGSRTTWCIVPGYQHSTHSMVGHTFRAAIDSMKGKS